MELTLCLATNSDYELMLAWRNDPEIKQGFYQQGHDMHNITWEEHMSWIKSRNIDWRTFVIRYQDRRIGIVTIQNLEHWAPELGYYVGEKTLWGRGIGKEAVRQALNYLVANEKQYARTTVIDKNTRAVRLAESLGFSRLGPSRPGESWYQVKLLF